MGIEAFEKLRVQSILSLFELLRANHGGRQSDIRRRFEELSEGFEEALTFAIRVGIVKCHRQSLVLTNQARQPDGSPDNHLILSAIMASRNRYRNGMFRFLRNFKAHDGELSYSPMENRRSSESYVRNFLIQLGVMRHNSTVDRYDLAPAYMGLLASAMDDANYTSPTLLKAHLNHRDDLGNAAEIAVVNYEKRRLGSDHAKKVRHVSLNNVSAGYDIKSITIDNAQIVVPRLIEVKAVPRATLRFYWTQNEVAVARALSSWYYLYLLPVDTRGHFDFDALEIISDPYRELFSSQSCWITDTQVIACYRSTST